MARWHKESIGAQQGHIKTIERNKQGKGKKLSKEHSRKLKEAHRYHDCSIHGGWHKGHWKAHLRGECFCGWFGNKTPHTSDTSFNRALEKLLAEYPEIIREKSFGRYRVDAYLPPPYHLVFEADCKYWHDKIEKEKPGYKKERDRVLIEEFGLVVIHLTDDDLTPWLKRE